MANGPKTKEGVNLYLKGLCFAVTVLGLGGGYLVINAISQSAAVARVETRQEGAQKSIDRIETAVNEVRTTVNLIKASQDRADADHSTIKTALKAEGKKAETQRPTPTAFEGYYGAVVKDPYTMNAIIEKAKASQPTDQPSKVLWVYTDDPKFADFLKGLNNPKVVPAPPK